MVSSIAIGPANYAGQAHAWTSAAREHLDIRAKSFGDPGPFKFPVDIPDPDTYRSWLLGPEAPTHLFVDGFRPVFGGRMFSDDLLTLTGLRSRVAVIAHGSELRDPDRHKARIPGSHFRDQSYTDRLRWFAQDTRKILDQTGWPLLVSTPDLLLEDVAADWLPVVVSHLMFGTELSSGIPKVLHAPSTGHKGSEVIMPVLRDLEAQGKIELVAPARVVHGTMPDLIRSCDILVEQIRAGSYGVAAVEGMAAGRLVVGYVAEDVRDLMEFPPPIVDAPPDQFEATMQMVVENWSLYRRSASLGPEFVAQYHDGRRSAEVLARFL